MCVVLSIYKMSGGSRVPFKPKVEDQMRMIETGFPERADYPHCSLYPLYLATWRVRKALLTLTSDARPRHSLFAHLIRAFPNRRLDYILSLYLQDVSSS